MAPLFLAALSPEASDMDVSFCTNSTPPFSLPLSLPEGQAEDCLDGQCTLESTSILRHPAMTLLRLAYGAWQRVPMRRQIVFALSDFIPLLDTLFTDLHALLHVQTRKPSMLSLHCLDISLWQHWLQDSQ